MGLLGGSTGGITRWEYWWDYYVGVLVGLLGGSSGGITRWEYWWDY